MGDRLVRQHGAAWWLGTSAALMLSMGLALGACGGDGNAASGTPGPGDAGTDATDSEVDGGDVPEGTLHSEPRANPLAVAVDTDKVYATWLSGFSKVSLQAIPKDGSEPTLLALMACSSHSRR
jgi:hypothetical protein